MTNDLFDISVTNDKVSYLFRQHQYATALPLARKAYEWVVEHLPITDATYQLSLTGLAYLYRETGQLAKAIPIFEDLLKATQATLPVEPESLAKDLNTLGEVCRIDNRWKQAEAYFKEALKLLDQNGIVNPLLTSAIDNNLGLLYNNWGDYDQAVEYFKKSLRFLEERDQMKTIDAAATLDNLGGAFWLSSEGDRQIRWLESLNYHRRAESIYQNNTETIPKDYALCLQNQGLLLMDVDDVSSAMALFEKAECVLRQELGKEHLSYVDLCLDIAEAHARLGQWVKAEEMFRSSLRLAQRQGRNTHETSIVARRRLARLYVRQSRPVRALALLRQIATIENKIVAELFSLGSERQKLAFIQSPRHTLSNMLSIVLGYYPTDSAAVRLVYDHVLLRKGLVAEASRRLNRAHIRDENPTLLPVLDKLDAVNTSFAELSMSGPQVGEEITFQAKFSQLEREKERLEKMLTGVLSTNEPRLVERQLVSSKSIALALPSTSVLVEFLKYPITPLQPGNGWPDGNSTVHYLAFILVAGIPDAVHLINLGEAAVVETQVKAYMNGLKKHRATGFVVPEVIGLGAELRERVFDPLKPFFGESTRLFLAPDGELSMLSFETLPMAWDHFLIDVYKLSYLEVGRDVLDFYQRPRNPAGRYLVVADPDFNLGSLEQDNTGLESLPATLEEGNFVASLLGTRCFSGASANKRVIKSVQSPIILHLATHGIYFSKTKRMPQAYTMISLGPAEAAHDPLLQIPTPHSFFLPDTRNSNRFQWLQKYGPQHPMLQVGLALAGFNTWLADQEPTTEAGNGFLSALEITGMNLSGTELVVLSACETGLGVSLSGEGIFGLRRAFLMAGARALLISLWKVPSGVTSTLMQEFYQQIVQGISCAEALRLAQLAIRKQYSNPYYWGGFICIGYPGSLNL